jgi:hypothetical protein
LVIAGDDASAGAARVLGILAVILYSSILLLWLVFRMQLEYQKIYKRVEDFIELAFLKRKRQGRRGDSATGISPTFVIYPLRVKLI